MAFQLSYILLITITTTLTNCAGGELFLQMPLTINPVIQDVITKRGTIVSLFSELDRNFYGRLTPVDMVISLDSVLSKVMRNTVSGALVLGAAAKSNGLKTEELLYNPHNKWTVNISLTDIKAVLNPDEENLYPFSADNITLTKLQNLGLRSLELKYNISLKKQAEQLHFSNASTFQDIQQDWINVVKNITANKINNLRKKYGVSVDKLAGVLNLTSTELYDVTLKELDNILLKDFSFLLSTTTQAINNPTSTKLPNSSNQSPTISTKPPIISTKSPTNARTSSFVGNKSTEKSTLASLNLVTTASSKPTETGKREENTNINLALFVGVAAGLLLLFVASSSIWCFRRKRRNCSQNEKKKSNNDIKMNNLWLDKTEIPSSPEQPHQTEQLRFVRSASTSTLGVDSRFKELQYKPRRPASSTFTSTTKVPITRHSFIYDYRKEIFV